jgi:hypothetical protein
MSGDSQTRPHAAPVHVGALLPLKRQAVKCMQAELQHGGTGHVNDTCKIKMNH